MGLISRVPSAPYQDGETLAGADLEGDFNTIYTEFNGNISAANIAANAITTAKILDGAVTAAKLDGTLTATVADDAITTVKILDGAVTTPKLAAAAVTQPKITLGSATGRFLTFSHTTVNLTTSFATIVTSGSYLTSTTAAGPIIVTVSLGLTSSTTSGSVKVTYQLLKDGVSLLGSGNTEDFQLGTATTSQNYVGALTRTYIDSSPTTSSFHAYTFQAKYTQNTGAGAAASMKDIVMTVMELRS